MTGRWIPPRCANWLNQQQREFVDELIRLLTQ